MEKKLTTKKDKTNPILWFFFVIVIPGIVALTLTLIILSIAGVDVKGWAIKTGSNIPVISTFVKTEEEKSIEEIEEKSKKSIAEKDTEIESLKQSVDNLEATIEQMEHDLIKAESQLNNEAEQSEEMDAIEEEQTSAIKSASASFRKMKSKEAALIFEKLETSVAVSILNELSNDTRGKILEAMEPELAAKLTELLIAENE